MFILVAARANAERSSIFYTGRAGELWLSRERREAFGYTTREAAEHKASVFNRATDLHGLTFGIEVRP